MYDVTTRPVRAPGLAIGIGMGGFVDGILLHQIFQLHNMLSARISTDDLVGAKVNMGSLHESALCVRQARTNSERHGSVVRRQADFGMVESCL